MKLIFSAIQPRRPDYLRALQAAGTLENDILEIDPSMLHQIESEIFFTRIPPAPPPHGAGDLIHAILHPIAVAADTLLGTDLQNCPTCAQRQAALNTLFPIP